MKKMIAMILLAAMLLALAACGAAAPDSAPANLTPTGGDCDIVPTEIPTAEPETEPETEAAPAEIAPVRVGAMTGPTGIGMVKLFKDAEQTGRYEKTIATTADELVPLFLKGELDIVALPANLAANLYNKGQIGVQALAVNVLGVLYFCEYNTDSIHAVSDLAGKTVYAAGQGSVPEFFMSYVLGMNDIPVGDAVNVEWKSEAAEVVATLSEKQSGVALLPQPYVTAAAVQLGEGFRVALSVSDEWDALNNDTRCVTACVVTRSEFAEAHPEAVEAFLADFAESNAWVNENVEAAAALCGEYDIVKAPIAAKAIPQCNLVCITGEQMRTALEGCLGVLFESAPQSVGGALPGPDFFYGAKN